MLTPSVDRVNTVNDRQPWLSVLIPVYNVELYLNECIQSVINQPELSGVEILLVDDCSTDGSLFIAKTLCAKYPDYIRLLEHTQNLGLSAARNSLLYAARGDYIWFLDSDDYLYPGSIKDLHAIIKKQTPDIIICDYRKRGLLPKKVFSGKGGKLEDCGHQLITGIFKYRKMYSWLYISRRNLWQDDLRFPVGKTFEDMATTPLLLLRAKTYYYAAKPWLYYRIRPGSIMTSVTRSPGFFDVRKNGDLASAMLGMKQAVVEQLGDNHDVMFYISNFIATEYTKLAKRHKSGKKQAPSDGSEYPSILYYFEKMQQCSPYNFTELSREYLKRGRLYRYWSLQRAMRQADVI